MFLSATFALVSINCLLGHVLASDPNLIEGINTNHINDFHCPSNTRRRLSHHEQQVEMDRFAYLFYSKKDVEAAFNQYVASNYVQHNPDILDGRDSAIKALTPLFSSENNTFEVSNGICSFKEDSELDKC